MAAAVAQANIRHLLLIENNLKSEEGATKRSRTTHVYLPLPHHPWGRFPCPLLPLSSAQNFLGFRVWRFLLFSAFCCKARFVLDAFASRGGNILRGVYLIIVFHFVLLGAKLQLSGQRCATVVLLSSSPRLFLFLFCHFPRSCFSVLMFGGLVECCNANGCVYCLWQAAYASPAGDFYLIVIPFVSSFLLDLSNAQDVYIKRLQRTHLHPSLYGGRRERLERVK